MGNDFATPSLYFFSTVAQTMGAIIAIVLAAVYAIIPQIQTNNNKIGSESLIITMKRDESLNTALFCGFSTILLSLISLLIIYFTGLSNTLSIIIAFPVGLSVIILGILSCINIWDFCSHKISMYNNILKTSSLVFKRIISNPNRIKSEYLAIIMYYDTLYYKHDDFYYLEKTKNTRIDLQNSITRIGDSFLEQVYNDLEVYNETSQLTSEEKNRIIKWIWHYVISYPEAVNSIQSIKIFTDLNVYFNEFEIAENNIDITRYLLSEAVYKNHDYMNNFLSFLYQYLSAMFKNDRFDLLFGLDLHMFFKHLLEMQKSNNLHKYFIMYLMCKISSLVFERPGYQLVIDDYLNCLDIVKYHIVELNQNNQNFADVSRFDIYKFLYLIYQNDLKLPVNTDIPEDFDLSELQQLFSKMQTRLYKYRNILKDYNENDIISLLASIKSDK